MKVAHSRYKQKINLVLTSVYKVNYPKQWPHIISKTNLRLMFSSNFNFIRVHNVSQELVKNMCVREVIGTVKPNLATMPSLCHRQSEA